MFPGHTWDVHENILESSFFLKQQFLRVLLPRGKTGNHPLQFVKQPVSSKWGASHLL